VCTHPFDISDIGPEKARGSGSAREGRGAFQKYNSTVGFIGFLPSSPGIIDEIRMPDNYRLSGFAYLYESNRFNFKDS
jgi:hypothetical protein